MNIPKLFLVLLIISMILPSSVFSQIDRNYGIVFKSSNENDMEHSLTFFNDIKDKSTDPTINNDDGIDISDDIKLVIIQNQYQIQFSGNHSKNLDIRLYNLIGEQLWFAEFKNIQDNTIPLEFQILNSGVYLIVVIDQIQQRKKTFKFTHK